MTRLLSPGFQRHYGGSPSEQTARQDDQWLKTFIAQIDERKRLSSLPPLDPVVQDLKVLMESEPSLRMWASAMFDEIPNKVPYNKCWTNHTPVRGYHHMLDLFNVIVTEVAPTWSMVEGNVGNVALVGLPFQAILDWPMGTPSGQALFLNKEVNAKLKYVLDTWRERILKTGKSKTVITSNKDGWLCEEALKAIEKDSNFEGQVQLTFEELFECDPIADPAHWGFASWDDFFVRQFRNIDKIRPVAYPHSPEWVTNMCESRPVVIQSGIKDCDRFWIKGTSYSVTEMLDCHEFAHEFIGGTAYQALLSLTSYHRWTSPVSGHVVSAQTIHGTYFSERPTNGLFSSPAGPPEYNQVYMSHIATRAIIYIQAEEPVGLMCAMAIGIADVSTCEIAKRFCTNLPQPVRKGEELGMFHYGGSGVCLLFRRGVRLAWMDAAVPGHSEKNIPVRSALAIAYADAARNT